MSIATYSLWVRDSIYPRLSLAAMSIVLEIAKMCQVKISALQAKFDAMKRQRAEFASHVSWRCTKYRCTRDRFGRACHPNQTLATSIYPLAVSRQALAGAYSSS